MYRANNPFAVKIQTARTGRPHDVYHRAMTPWRSRLGWLTADPPVYEARPIDRRTVSILGLEVPVLATFALALVTVLLLYDRNYDVLPRFGPIDPRSLRNQAIERFVVFGLLPLVLLLLLHEDPRRYGLRIGDWRRGLVIGGALALVSVPAIVVIALVPDIQAWYAPSMTTLPGVTLTMVLDLFPAEFLMRGFVLFILVRAVGPLGVIVAIVPFTFTHIGKPDIEAFSTLVGGLVFGWLVWRTGSIVYSAAYHVVIQTTVIVAAAYWAAGG
jgi:membrane protease YdiL (CAAX protease family)